MESERRQAQRSPSSFFESILFPFVEEIGFGTSQVHDLRTTVSVFLQDGAFLAVVGVTDAHTAADDTPSFVGPIIALVADSNQCAGPHIRIANHTFTIALRT